jgi:hypothetical protein
MLPDAVLKGTKCKKSKIESQKLVNSANESFDGIIDNLSL